MKKVTKSLVVWGLAFGLVFGVGTVGAMYVDSKTHNGLYLAREKCIKRQAFLQPLNNTYSLHIVQKE
ncbi:hypothetical protein [Halalkalibacterium halodurans]|nr:hypothetical protein [Halalkalibacterium halodurans]